MTNELNVCIGVSTADCIPILLYDTKHQAAAVNTCWLAWNGEAYSAENYKRNRALLQTKPQELQAVIRSRHIFAELRSRR